MNQAVDGYAFNGASETFDSQLLMPVIEIRTDTFLISTHHAKVTRCSNCHTDHASSLTVSQVTTEESHTDKTKPILLFDDNCHQSSHLSLGSLQLNRPLAIGSQPTTNTGGGVGTGYYYSMLDLNGMDLSTAEQHRTSA